MKEVFQYLHYTMDMNTAEKLKNTSKGTTKIV